MSDPLDVVQDLMEGKKYKEAIELAYKEAENDQEYEYQFRQLIGKAMLDDYFSKPQEQRQNFPEQAQVELQKSWGLKKEENEIALLLLADAEFELRRFQDAKAHYQELLKVLQAKGDELEIKQSEAFYGIGKCEQQLHQYAEAINQFQNVIDRKGKNEFTFWGALYLNRALCYFNLDDLQNSLADVSLAQKSGNTSVSVITLQGKILKQQGKFDEAEKFIKNLPKEFETNPMILDLKGSIFLQQHKYKDAEAIFKQIPGFQGQLGLASSYYNQAKYKEAIPLYEEVLKQDPQNANALVNLGQCYISIDDYPKAKEQFLQQLKLNQNDCDALNGLGNAERMIGKAAKTEEEKQAHYSEGLKYLEQATKTTQMALRAGAFNAIGLINMENKKNEEAYTAFTSCISADPKFIMGWFNKAMCEQALQKPAESLASLKEAQKLLGDKYVQNTLTQKQMTLIENGLKKIVQLQEHFGKQADEIQKNMEKILKRPNALAGHKNLLDEFEKLEAQKIEMLKKKYDSVSTSSESNNDKEFEELLKKYEALQKKQVEQEKQYEVLEKKQQEQAKRTAALEQRVDKMRDTLRKSGVYDKANIAAWMKENRLKEEGKYAKAFYWTLLNYFDSYRAASTGILETNVEHAEIDGKVSGGVALAKSALSAGSSLCQSIPLVGSIFKVIDGAIDYCYSEYKQKKFEDKVNSINKIIMENHTANTQEDLSQVITKAAIEIAKKKSTAKVFIQLQFELDNPKPKGTIDKIVGFFTSKIDQIREYALGKKIDLYDSVGGGEALKDVILLLAHLQKNFDDVIKKSESILLDIQFEQIVTEKIQQLLKDMKEVPTTLTPIQEEDWEVPKEQSQEYLDEFAREQKEKEEEKKKKEEEKQKQLQAETKKDEQPPQKPPEQPQAQPQQQQAQPQQQQAQPQQQQVQPPKQQEQTQQPPNKPPEQPPNKPPQQPPEPAQNKSQQQPESVQNKPPQQPPPQQNQQGEQHEKTNKPQESSNSQAPTPAPTEDQKSHSKQQQPEQTRESSCCVIF